MSQSPVKIAVIGVGYLGRWHADKLSRMKGAELVGLVDVDLERAREIARKTGTEAYADYKDVINQVDAVTIVTPTIHHHKVAKDFLLAGKDVLSEKPITATQEEAAELVELAAKNDRILQVGHLERFNPAVEEMARRVTRPIFIECNRIAPYKARATDVDVALDLMIHDLDIILSVVGEEPCAIHAAGVPVLGEHADIINTRLEFPGGCVANVTASRLALKDERKMRIFQPDSYVALDFKKRKLLVVDKVEYIPGKKPKVKTERPRFGKSDPLEAELKAFVESVGTRKPPRVSGEDGARALACALAIRKEVDQRLAGAEGLLDEPRAWVGACAEEDE